MGVPEDVGLYHVQPSLFSFRDDPWPHLERQQDDRLRYEGDDEQEETSLRNSSFTSGVLRG